MRAVLQAAGVQNVVSKSLGTTNPHNVVRATFAGLGSLKDPVALARLPRKELQDLTRANV